MNQRHAPEDRSELDDSESTIDPFDWLVLGAEETEYLKQLKLTHRARARAARRWRPKFLRALADSCSLMFALGAAKVSYNTVRSHETQDPTFAAHLRDAQEQAAQLLHDVCWKAAVEGNLEPVYWEGKLMGHVRKVDSRLRIEMLRAHLPNLFKTPGVRAAAATSRTGSAIQVTPEVAATIQAKRKQAIEAIQAKDAALRAARPNG